MDESRTSYEDALSTCSKFTSGNPEQEYLRLMTDYETLHNEHQKLINEKGKIEIKYKELQIDQARVNVANTNKFKIETINQKQLRNEVTALKNELAVKEKMLMSKINQHSEYDKKFSLIKKEKTDLLCQISNLQALLKANKLSLNHLEDTEAQNTALTQRVAKLQACIESKDEAFNAQILSLNHRYKTVFRQF